MEKNKFRPSLCSGPVPPAFPVPDQNPQPEPQPEPDYDPAPVTETEPAIDKPLCQPGSIILTENQVLGEMVPIVGANFQLAYFTNKVVGRTGDYTIRIPLTSKSYHPHLKQVKYSVTINNQLLESKTVIIAPNLSARYIWNGLTAGKTNLGSGLAEVVIEYIPNGGKTSFAAPVGSLQVKNLGFGNWIPTNYHFYDANRKQLFRGDGSSLLAPAELINSHQLRVIDSDRSLVYIFEASTGRHLQTKTFWLGTTLYSFNYDKNGLLVSISEPFQKSTYFNRNGSGELVSVRASNGQTTLVTLDVNKFISSVTSPAGQTYSFTYYDAGGMLKTFKKPQGQVSTFTYDTLGNLVQDAHSGGYAVSIKKEIEDSSTYVLSTSQMGRLSQVITENIKEPIEGEDKFKKINKRTVYRADGTSTLTLSSNNATYVNQGGTVFYTASAQDPRFKEYSNTQLLKVVSGPTIYKGVERQENYTFNDASNPFSIREYFLTETDQSGNQTFTNYSGESKSFLKTTARGSTIFTIIDELERPVYVQRGNDQPVEYVYENNLLRSVTQGERSVSYNYDERSGKVSAKINSLSQWTNYTYDEAGRLTSTEYPDGKKLLVSYDSNGNVVGINPADKPKHNFTFNSLELITSYSPPILADNSQTQTIYTYNADKQVTSITKPDGKKIVYNYDVKTGVIKSVVTSEGTYAYFFDSNYGTYDRIITPSGLETKRSRLDGGLLRSDALLKNSKQLGYYQADFSNAGELSNEYVADNSNFSALGYDVGSESKLDHIGNQKNFYDKDSGRVSKTEMVSGSTILISDSYTYNQYGELSGYVVKFRDSVLYSFDLTYDQLGRIVKKVETIKGISSTFEYSYDVRGRLIEVKKDGNITSRYGFDGNGNRTSGAVNGQAIISAYDSQDRLTAYNSLSYQYNANGELISKKNGITNQAIHYGFNSFGSLISVNLGSNTASYEIDGLGRRAQNIINGKLQSSFIYKDAIRLAAVIGPDGKLTQQFGYSSKFQTPDLLKMGQETYRIISDNLGSVRLVIRASDGKIVQEILHDEFGKVLKNTAPDFQPFGFAGGLYDPNTNLVQFGARWYDPEIGRWISKDPSLFAGGNNLYEYAVNSPINFIDSNGRAPMQISNEGGGYAGGGGGGGGGAIILPGIQEIVKALASKSLPGPGKGPPNGTLELEDEVKGGKRQKRYYDENGNPVKDIDYNHDHGQGVPHVHDWTPDRGPGRKPEPGECDD